MVAERSKNSGEPREDAHRLLDAVPDDRVSVVLTLLRQLAEQPQAHRPGRQFRTVGVFDGETDLGKRTKEILRHELGGKSSKTA